jgi:hypothetical protein
MVVAILSILAFGSCLNRECYIFAQTDQAEMKLQAASVAIEQAFNAVLDAENVGANVTILYVQLNNATWVLAQAQNSYRTGNSSTAIIQADSVLPIALKVINTAQEVKTNTLVSVQNTFWFTFTLTVIGAILFVLVLFLLWRWFKRIYINRLTEAKPKVKIYEF